MNPLAERRDRQLLEQLTDLEVVRRVRDGEPALFELIMRRYNRRLFRIARGILGSDAETEDAVQEAYIKAYFRLGQFRGPEGFPSWICRIVTHEALMKRRSGLRATIMPLSAVDDTGHQEPAVPYTRSIDSTPEVDLHERQLQFLMEEAIDALPETYRAVFVLREVEQLSVAETAQCLDLEAATVKTRVHRARRLLQRELSAELSTALTGVFGFDGARCDRLVARVFRRLNGELTF